MKTTHTPGPWEAHGQAIYAGDTYVAQCWDETSRELHAYKDAVGNIPVPSNGAEAQANARLMASAPELLSALQRFASAMEQRSYPELQGIACDAFAAIAKATGSKVGK
jgi:hypothetical protein